MRPEHLVAAVILMPNGAFQARERRPERIAAMVRRGDCAVTLRALYYNFSNR